VGQVVTSVIAVDVNETPMVSTLWTLRSRICSAAGALRPQWFA
jgi:2-haloacid dehalogenase